MKIVSDIEKIGAVDVNEEIYIAQAAITVIINDLQEKYNVHPMLITGLLDTCKLATMISFEEIE